MFYSNGMLLKLETCIAGGTFRFSAIAKGPFNMRGDVKIWLTI